jgi:tRNA modification GTPase
MFAPDDTIVAVATAAGQAGIGVVRISGEEAVRIASAMLELRTALQPRHATFARLKPCANGRQAGDEVIATWFEAPRSYTGQHVIEISAHGSVVVLDGIVRRAVAAGARLARPGEFTLRAFLAGKRDLVQAEAVADLIDAVTPLQARTAFDQLDGTLTRRIAALDGTLYALIAQLEASLDFPDEGYHFVEAGDVGRRLGAVIADLDNLLGEAARGRMIRDGATVVLAGRTNVGKSSIFNALAGAERAIVTAVPGTTRDLVSERIDLEGVLVTLVDTAGVREAVDVVEREGVARGAQAREVAALLLVVLDASEPLHADDRAVLQMTAHISRVIVLNKCDAGDAPDWLPHICADRDSRRVQVSALTGLGLPQLRAAIVRSLSGGEALRESAAVSNVRHVVLLQDARRALSAARHGCEELGVPEEFVLADLQTARAALDEVVGRRTTDDLLRHIFERFCIGK